MTVCDSGTLPIDRGSGSAVDANLLAFQDVVAIEAASANIKDVVAAIPVVLVNIGDALLTIKGIMLAILIVIIIFLMIGIIALFFMRRHLKWDTRRRTSKGVSSAFDQLVEYTLPACLTGGESPCRYCSTPIIIFPNGRLFIRSHSGLWFFQDEPDRAADIGEYIWISYDDNAIYFLSFPFRLQRPEGTYRLGTAHYMDGYSFYICKMKCEDFEEWFDYVANPDDFAELHRDSPHDQRFQGCVYVDQCKRVCVVLMKGSVRAACFHNHHIWIFDSNNWMLHSFSPNTYRYIKTPVDKHGSDSIPINTFTLHTLRYMNQVESISPGPTKNSLLMFLTDRSTVMQYDVSSHRWVDVLICPTTMKHILPVPNGDILSTDTFGLLKIRKVQDSLFQQLPLRQNWQLYPRLDLNNPSGMTLDSQHLKRLRPLLAPLFLSPILDYILLPYCNTINVYVRQVEHLLLISISD